MGVRDRVGHLHDRLGRFADMPDVVPPRGTPKPKPHIKLRSRRPPSPPRTPGRRSFSTKSTPKELGDAAKALRRDAQKQESAGNRDRANALHVEARAAENLKQKKEGRAPESPGRPFSGGETPDEAAVTELQEEWARLNLALYPYVGNPDHPQARKIIERQKEVTKSIHHLHTDRGGKEGIGKPGEPHDVVVVGAGPAGLSSAIYGAAEGLDTLLLDAQPESTPGGQAGLSTRIENVLGYPAGVEGDQLARSSLTQAQRLGAQTEHGPHARVVKLEVDKKTGLKTLTLAGGRKVTTRSVVVAGGVEFHRLDIPGLDDDKLVYGDAKKLREICEDNLPAAIIGGANSAGQAAIDAAAHLPRVTIVVRSTLEKGMSKYLVDQVRNHPRIEVIEGTEVERVERGASEGPARVVLKNGTYFDAAGVGAFLGGGPKADWTGLPTDKKGAIITKHGDVETDTPGVYAVGDVRSGAIRRVIVAAADGAHAVSKLHAYLPTVDVQEAARISSGTDLKKLAARWPNDAADEWLDRVDKLDREQPFTDLDDEGSKMPEKKLTEALNPVEIAQRRHRNRLGQWTDEAILPASIGNPASPSTPGRRAGKIGKPYFDAGKNRWTITRNSPTGGSVELLRFHREEQAHAAHAKLTRAVGADAKTPAPASPGRRGSKPSEPTRGSDALTGVGQVDQYTKSAKRVRTGKGTYLVHDGGRVEVSATRRVLRDSGSAADAAAAIKKHEVDTSEPQSPGRADKLAAMPVELKRIDPGAEHIGKNKKGESLWHAVVKPPSGMEKDVVYLADRAGKIRKATQADYDEMNGPASPGRRTGRTPLHQQGLDEGRKDGQARFVPPEPRRRTERAAAVNLAAKVIRDDKDVKGHHHAAGEKVNVHRTAAVPYKSLFGSGEQVGEINSNFYTLGDRDDLLKKVEDEWDRAGLTGFEISPDNSYVLTVRDAAEQGPRSPGRRGAQPDPRIVERIKDLAAEEFSVETIADMIAQDYGVDHATALKLARKAKGEDKKRTRRSLDGYVDDNRKFQSYDGPASPGRRGVKEGQAPPKRKKKDSPFPEADKDEPLKKHTSAFPKADTKKKSKKTSGKTSSTTKSQKGI